VLPPVTSGRHTQSRRIGIAADHGGFHLKAELMEQLRGSGHQGSAVAWDLICTFLTAEFSNAERHLRRLAKVGPGSSKV
jgi:ribose 5-phosphate isomerase RpiB